MARQADSGLMLARYQHRSALKAACPQVSKRLVCLRKRIARDMRFDGNRAHKVEKLKTIAPRQVGHRPDAAFAPEPRVWNGGNVTHVDSRADDGAALDHLAQRERHERTHWREDDCAAPASCAA